MISAFSILAIVQSPTVGLTAYLLVGTILSVCGLMAMLLKRNAIGMLMGVELVLNAANVNLVAFNHFRHSGTTNEPAIDGQIFAVFVILLAAAEAAVALAIFLNFYNNFNSIDVERGSDLKG